MRRMAVALALFLIVAPALVRLTASSSEAAASCALACARADRGVEKGASCCPTGHGAALPTLSSCARDDAAAAVPGTAPMLLAAPLLLILPSATRRPPLAPAFALPSAPSRVPDKVPLLLG